MSTITQTLSDTLEPNEVEAIEVSAVKRFVESATDTLEELAIPDSKKEVIAAFLSLALTKYAVEASSG